MSWLEQVLCKHKWVYLIPAADTQGIVIVPIRVCQHCQKITWATYHAEDFK